MAFQELPVDRLTTVDEQGRRLYVYPADVKGKWRSRRSIVSTVLMVFFLVLPWVRINGRQALLLDIPHRQFTIFGLTFWAHDAPMLLFVFGGAAVTLFLVTALWGRVWCGWACPQTVFVDAVFRRIERLVEGDGLTRRRLDAAPWSTGKALKKSTKWLLFAAVSLLISHSFLAFFVGTEPLSQMVRSNPADNPVPFLVMFLVTSAVLFDFGWFREQFCTLVCPYGRFQAVLMDKTSLAVTYVAARGEPRRGTAAPGAVSGDCVSCNRCVQVCPTGIDIRRGVQMECVACTACMDACDEVMHRVHKPQGLIRYQAEDPSSSRWTPRAFGYLGVLTVLCGGLIWSVATRKDLSVWFVRAVAAPYQEIPGTSGRMDILNHYKADVKNQSFEDRAVRFEIAPEFQARGVMLTVSNLPAKIKAGGSARSDLFIRFPKDFIEMGRGKLPIQIHHEGQSLVQEVSLVGPLR